MLVKRALTSNETKVSSSGFIEIFLISLMKSVHYLLQRMKSCHSNFEEF